jgi:hypothetical protein
MNTHSGSLYTNTVSSSADAPNGANAKDVDDASASTANQFTNVIIFPASISIDDLLTAIKSASILGSYNLKSAAIFVLNSN